MLMAPEACCTTSRPRRFTQRAAAAPAAARRCWLGSCCLSSHCSWKASSRRPRQRRQLAQGAATTTATARAAALAAARVLLARRGTSRPRSARAQQSAPSTCGAHARTTVCGTLHMRLRIAAYLPQRLVFMRALCGSGADRLCAATHPPRCRAGDHPLLRLVLQPPTDGLLQPGGSFGLLLDFRDAHGQPPGVAPQCLQVCARCCACCVQRVARAHPCPCVCVGAPPPPQR